MTAEAILADLLACGIEPAVTPSGDGIIVPAGRLTTQQRGAILACKAELIGLLLDSARITDELLAAAMRACDHWGDSQQAREQMRRECLETPPAQRADLLAHFNDQYRKATK